MKKWMAELANAKNQGGLVEYGLIAALLIAALIGSLQVDGGGHEALRTLLLSSVTNTVQ
jgi:Flp pilus assembly pilin Flp